MKDLSIDKIGKVWQDLSWMNGWTKNCIEQQIYDECRKRGYRFEQSYHNPRGFTGYRCEKAKVCYEIDSSD